MGNQTRVTVVRNLNLKVYSPLYGLIRELFLQNPRSHLQDNHLLSLSLVEFPFASLYLPIYSLSRIIYVA
jgi:hypothetical protein